MISNTLLKVVSGILLVVIVGVIISEIVGENPAIISPAEARIENGVFAGDPTGELVDDGSNGVSEDPELITAGSSTTIVSWRDSVPTALVPSSV